MCSLINGQTPPENYKNPIIPGFHPDPSICRVGDDYYLVTSSFEWFPGVPIYHSKDLVNWEHIGNVLDRPEQLDLEPGHRHNGGIWAPTIRYNEGLFYMITTVAGKGNFYVTATNPAGPWSDPVWLKSARGIDPSLFWDDDGRCYFTAAANISGSRQWPGQNGCYIQELDLENKKLIGPRVQMTHGHATNARYTEGPHIFKIDGRYFLMVAEGGTGVEHCITVFESDSLLKEFTPSHTNPIITHRHLGKNYPIGMLGHGDFVETQNGEWWCVMLGRRVKDNLSMLARETFLAKVTWEDSWPLINEGEGKVLFEGKRPDLPWSPVEPFAIRNDFNKNKLEPYWNFLRTPQTNWFTLTGEALTVNLRPEKLTELDNPSMIVRRIQHFNYTASTKLTFNSKKSNEEAGLTAFLDNKSHYRLNKKAGVIELIKVEEGNETVIASAPYKTKDVVFSVEANMFEFTFKYGEDENNLQQIGGVQDARVITAQSFIGTGFNGPYVGMYASSNGESSKNKAEFDWFEYNAK